MRPRTAPAHPGARDRCSSYLSAGAVVVPSLLREPGPPWGPRRKGGDQGLVRRSHQVVRQMPEREVHDIAVVRLLFARGLRQVEPEAMDELHILLRQLGRVRS